MADFSLKMHPPANQTPNWIWRKGRERRKGGRRERGREGGREGEGIGEGWLQEGGNLLCEAEAIDAPDDLCLLRSKSRTALNLFIRFLQISCLCTTSHANESRESKGFTRVCLCVFVRKIEPKELKLQSPNLPQR